MLKLLTGWHWPGALGRKALTWFGVCAQTQEDPIEHIQCNPLQQ